MRSKLSGLGLVSRALLASGLLAMANVGGGGRGGRGGVADALLFNVDQFIDLTEDCKTREGKPINYILNEDNPAMYISIDAAHPIKAINKRLGRKMDQHKLYGSLADGRVIQDFMDSSLRASFNETFDCVLEIETELPKGEKSRERYDALSLIIIELNYSSGGGHHGDSGRSRVEISTLGHEGKNKKRVSKKAHYSDRIWAATNPNFLLSGQLSGFDSIDYRTKVDSQHIIRPETLHSTFDKPARITVNVTKWSYTSQIYMVFTSYKYLRGGSERCQDGKEFDCSPPSFLSSSKDHMCMSSNLACDGLPNCGQDFLPNQDENCFKIHWSSVLLSLVSYILLAITLLLCLSCFARVLIQWSVRSSLAELRGGVGAAGPGIGSPTGSFRSSSRFFSFLGSTFTSRWERPPPTYDEAMKHVNPDIARPLEPPAYSDTFNNQGERERPGPHPPPLSGGASSAAAATVNHTVSLATRLIRRGSSVNDAAASRGHGGGGIIQTPPPEYDSQESRSHAFLEIGSPVCLPPPPPPPPHSVSSSLAPVHHSPALQQPPAPAPATRAGKATTSRSAEALLSASSPAASSSSASSSTYAFHVGGKAATRSVSSAAVTATIEAEICNPPPISHRLRLQRQSSHDDDDEDDSDLQMSSAQSLLLGDAGADATGEELAPRRQQ